MKHQLSSILIALAISTFSACGSGGAPLAAGSSPSTAPSPALPVWTMAVQGDGISFTLSMITELETVTIGPVTIPAGQTLTYTANGSSFQSGGITRISGSGTLDCVLSKDGAGQESTSLTTNGTYHNFSAH